MVIAPSARAVRFTAGSPGVRAVRFALRTSAVSSSDYCAVLVARTKRARSLLSPVGERVLGESKSRPPRVQTETASSAEARGTHLDLEGKRPRNDSIGTWSVGLLRHVEETPPSYGTNRGIEIVMAALEKSTTSGARWPMRIYMTPESTELAQQLRALLKQHGPTDLLRALSAGARELAEERPDQGDEWLRAALIAAQTAEALADDASHASTVEEDGDEGDAEDEPDEGEDMPSDGDEGEEENEPDDEDMPYDGVETSSNEPTSSRPSPNEEASMKKSHVIAPPEKTSRTGERTAFRRTARTAPSSIGGTTKSSWANGRSANCRSRPFVTDGAPVVTACFGTVVTKMGQPIALGRSNPIRLIERVGESRPSEPVAGARIPEVPTAPAPGVPSELLAALAAMRPSPGGGGALTWRRCFSCSRSWSSGKTGKNVFAADRLHAEREIMLERERLASKERIAQIEATAQVQRAGRARRRLRPRGACRGHRPQGAGGDRAAPGRRRRRGSRRRRSRAGSSDLATIVNAIKETLAPLLPVIATKVMTASRRPAGATNRAGPHDAAVATRARSWRRPTARDAACSRSRASTWATARRSPCSSSSAATTSTAIRFLNLAAIKDTGDPEVRDLALAPARRVPRPLSRKRCMSFVKCCRALRPRETRRRSSTRSTRFGAARAIATTTRGASSRSSSPAGGKARIVGVPN